MFKINENCSEGMKDFAKQLNLCEKEKEGRLGEGSGYYSNSGKLVIYKCFNEQLSEGVLDEKDNIKELIIRNNELEEDSYKIIEQLSSLKRLVLESVGTYVLELNPDNLTELTELTINLVSNAELPQWVCKLKSLKRLDISRTRIDHIDDLSDNFWEKCELINVSNTDVKNLPEFSKKNFACSNLEMLSIANTGISGIPRAYITKKLRYLDCNNTNISIRNLSNAEGLEIFLCRNNSNIGNLNVLPTKNLRVLELSGCSRIIELPNKDFDKLEILSLCECSLKTLPEILVTHCIDNDISFKQEKFDDMDGLIRDGDLDYDLVRENAGIYLNGTFLQDMDSRYLLESDMLFLKEYLQKQRNNLLKHGHEVRINLLGSYLEIKENFLKLLLEEDACYTEYGGLKILNTDGGELDCILNMLDRDAEISINILGNGINEKYMQKILFNEYDIFLIVLDARDGLNNLDIAKAWLKEIEQYVQYATIGFVIVGRGYTDNVFIGTREMKRVCERQYFRFIENAYYINSEEYDAEDLRRWLIQGIRDKSNYEVMILPEWKQYRKEIVSYLNLRRVISGKRLKALFPDDGMINTTSFINYLKESRSFFQIAYENEGGYYFNTEWIYGALFELLDFINKNACDNGFSVESLRIKLQTDSVYFFDFFQDRESIEYLLDILQEMGVLYKLEQKYYYTIGKSILDKDDERDYKEIRQIINAVKDVKYKMSYPILTLPMYAQIVRVLLKNWVVRRKSSHEIWVFKEGIVFRVERTDYDRPQKSDLKGYIFLQVTPNAFGEILLYTYVEKGKTGIVKIEAEKYLMDQIKNMIGDIASLQNFPLWQANISVPYSVRGMSDYIRLDWLENFIHSGYNLVYMPCFKQVVDVEALYEIYRIDRR